MTLKARLPYPKHNGVSIWLFVCLAMIFAMAVIGAITRLTESGLSIMEWAPIKGTLPPLSEGEWQRLFSLYQQTDEFKYDNPEMDMAGFKTIFWWEWIHRFWGRAMGLVFGVGLLWFWLRGTLPSWIKPYLVVALVLGGLQGTIGWFMVVSGFDDGLTDVSHYRLALHLVFALVLYGLLLLVTLAYMRRDLGFMQSENPVVPLYLKWVTFFGACFLSLIIVSGAFVAGKNAGLIYNEWPLMGGRFVPLDYLPDGWTLIAAILNHDSAIQFNHRWLAMAFMLFTLALAYFARMKLTTVPLIRCWFGLLAVGVILQFMLGLLALLSLVTVISGALHQAGAIILLTIYLTCLFQLYSQSSGKRSLKEP